LFPFRILYNITSIILDVALIEMILPWHFMGHGKKSNNITSVRRIPPSPYVFHGEKPKKFNGVNFKR
jgi:hypothetical protein